MKTVAFVVPDRVQLLDVAGPAQVFSTLRDLTGEPSTIVYVGEQQTVQSKQGLPVNVSTDWPGLTPDDLLIIPGFAATAHPLNNNLLASIAAHHAAGGTIASICAGAFIVAEAGLLDGRRATTHHDLQDILGARYPHVHVVRDVLFVGGQGIYTSAGIASGIDLSLHLVEQHFGARIAARIARTMVVYARRNGNMEQHSVMLRYRDHCDDLVHRIQDFLNDHFAQSFTLADLARRGNVSERTLSRSFMKNIGLTPSQYQRAVRLEHAELLVAQGATMEQAARQVGFADARSLRKHRA